MILPTRDKHHDIVTMSSLPAEPQTTIADDAVVEGAGYVTGTKVAVRFRPAPADTGLVFVRVDLKGEPRIPARLAHIVDRRLRTTLAIGSVKVEMTEHVLAALSGLRIDNCLIEINGPETPGMDGSALAFTQALDGAGLVALEESRPLEKLTHPIHVAEGDASLAIHPGRDDCLAVTYTLDYPHVRAIGRQTIHLEVTPDIFRREIAPARTFILERDIDALRAQGLGQQTSADDLLVIGEDGVKGNSLRFPDECVRHKILDIIGDLALVGSSLRGHVMGHKSGHRLNALLARRWLEDAPLRQQADWLALPPVMEAADVEKALPHRYPILLLDRVVLLEDNRRAVGLKNVSSNEPHFQGHWPGRPIMPGVLILEALAQICGIMLVDWRRQTNHALLVGIDNVRLRNPVRPGDQLWLEATARKLKSHVAVVDTQARVGRDIVAEAVITFARPRSA